MIMSIKLFCWKKRKKQDRKKMRRINKTQTVCTQYDRLSKINLIATLKSTHKIDDNIKCNRLLSMLVIRYYLFIIDITHVQLYAGNGSKLTGKKWNEKYSDCIVVHFIVLDQSPWTTNGNYNSNYSQFFLLYVCIIESIFLKGRNKTHAITLKLVLEYNKFDAAPHKW